MYRLFQSDDLRSLVLEHPTLFGRELGSEPSLLIVQNGPMQKWLNRILAVERGIWLAPDMATPDQALRLMLRDTLRPFASQGRTAIYMDDLKLLCFQTLRYIVRQSSKNKSFKDVYEKIGLPQNLPDGSTGHLRTVYGIADALAGLLYSYAQNFFEDPKIPGSRTHLFDIWNEGSLLSHSLTGKSQSFQELVRSHEIWQREIYLLMFPEQRIYDILGYQTHRAVIENWKYQGPYKRVVLFGSAFLSAQAFAFFRSIAQEIEVVHCLLTPATGLAVEQSTVQTVINSEAVSAWSELLSTFVNESAQIGNTKAFSARWLPGLRNKSSSNLHILQNILSDSAPELLSLKPHSPETMPAVSSSRSAATKKPALEFDFGTADAEASIDHSLRFIDCGTRQREVEALKQRILRLLAERNGDVPPTPGPTPKTQLSFGKQATDDGPIKLTEIAIMAPDIREYRPYIETIFNSLDQDGKPRQDHLPTNIVDLSFGDGSAVVAALEAILELDASRLERSTLFALLDNAAVCKAAHIDHSDVELFRRWAEFMEARWGLNAEHRAALKTGFNWQNTWDRALARFIDGGIDGTLPATRVDIARISIIMSWLHQTFNTVNELASAVMTIEEWTARIRRFIDQCIAAPDELEGSTMERIRGILANLNTSYRNLVGSGAAIEPLKAPIDWFGFKTLFRDQLSHLSASRGQHQIDGIVCSSIRPYRAIPFKVIAILGMNEGEFPRPDDKISFDLSTLPGQNIAQVNNQVQDSYAWLETLASAQEYLWVFYQGRDPSSGESRNPSSLVEDTWELFASKTGNDPEILKTQEKISPFDQVYFSSQGPKQDLWNLSQNELDIACSLQVQANAPMNATGTRAARSLKSEIQSELLTLRFSDLLEFLVYPIKSAFKHRLDIRMDDGADPALEDREPLDPQRSQYRRAGKDFLEAFWTGGDSDNSSIIRELEASWYAEDRLVEGPLSTGLIESYSTFLTRLSQEMDSKILGGSGKPGFHAWHAAAPVALDIPLSVGDQARMARLEAELNNYYIAQDGSGLLLLPDYKAVLTGGKFKKSHIATIALVSSLALASGLPRPSRVAVIPSEPSEADPKKGLFAIFDIAELPLFSVRQMVEHYARNLAEPFPLYGNISEELVVAIGESKQRQNSQLDAILSGAWQKAWTELEEPGPFDDMSWPPANPLVCPFFKRAWPDRPAQPSWSPWYGRAFLDIWQPLETLRDSFKRSRKTAQNKAGQ